GDLPPRERSLVAAQLARDPELAKRLEPFRFTREELVDAYASTLQAAGPDAESLLRLTSHPSSLSRATPTLFSEYILPWLGLGRGLMATAALAALVLACVSGWLMRATLHPDDVGLIAPASMQRALDETPSNGSGKLPGDRSIRPTSTFASLQRRWCR